MNYAEILQESIIETLMCIYHGINDPKGRRELPNYLSFILQFIGLTTEKSRHPKLDYVKECLMLLADITSMYPEVKQRIKEASFISDRTAILLKFNKDGHLNQTIAYVKQQFQLTL